MNPFVYECLAELPLIAILRGVEPHEAVGIGTALHDAGIRVMEVTLNSPDPLPSIEALAKRFDGRMAVGAGTVLTVDEVDAVHAAGAQLVVSPVMDPGVIRRTVELGMHSVPGVLTPTECFQAIRAGADGLKIFPATMVGIGGLRQMMAVLPKEFDLFAVGGVDTDNLADWLALGIKGVGLGSNLYHRGDSPQTVADKAGKMVGLMKTCGEWD